jgi:DNA-binding IclR family transcriptional regulator
MHRVWALTGETVALFIPQGDKRLCVAETPSLQPLSFKRGVGYTERLGLGASGRAIVAFGDYEPTQIKSFANDAKLSLGNYEKELKLTRDRGYATSRDELITGAVAVAVPFFDGNGQVSGSLGVFGPSVRMPTQRIEELGELLKNESKVLSQNLGLRAA